MSSRSLLKIIKVLIFAVVIATPLFYIKQTVFPFAIPKTALFQSLVEFIFFLWLALAISDRKYRPRLTPAIIGLAVFLAAMVLASAVGVDPWRSFWSIYERAFGVVTFLHFGAFAVVLSALWQEIPWRKILYSSIVTCAVVGIIAVLQLSYPNLLLNEGAITRSGSTFDNPSFLAGYVLFHIFLSLYFLFNLKKAEAGRAEQRQGPRVPWLAVLLVAALALDIAVVFLTQTRAAILALAAGFFVLFVFFAFRPPETEWLPGFLKKKQTHRVVILLIVLAGTLFWFTRTSSLWAQIPGLGRFHDISLSGGGDILPRIIALNAAWRGFLDKPVLGWGWDNFNIVFNKYYDPRALEYDYVETRFDKPHNFFMEYLVSGGVVLTLGFLFMLGALLYEARLRKENIFYPMFMAAIAAFLVQNLFIFDTLGPALMLFLFFGFVDGDFANSKKKMTAEPEKRSPAAINAFAFAACAMAALVLTYQFNFLTVQASNYEWNAFNDFSQGRQQDSINNFRAALGVWSPYKWNYGRDFAANVITAYFYSQGAISDNEALLALSFMEETKNEHPLDAYNHYALVDMYNEVSDIDPGKFLPLAEKEAAIALDLSPNRQEVYFSMAKTKHLEGDKKAALELAKHALDLDPKVPDAHFYYGLLLFSDGDFANGYKEVKEAISLGRRWKNFYEPRTIAGFFGDFEPPKHLDEAIDLYKIAFSMEPDDLETQIKLGIAYYFKSDFANAQDYLNKAATRFDFRNSPAFSELKPILDQLRVNY